MNNTPDDYSGSSGSTESSSLITEQVKQGAQQAVQQSQQMAGQVAQGAQQKAESMLSSRKDQMTETLCSAAQAMRQTGETLRTQNQGPIAGAADAAADKVEGLAGYFEQRDIGQIVLDTERYARGNPAVFLGGAFLLGLAAARFLKSSSTSGQGSSDYGRYNHYDSPYDSRYTSGYNAPRGYGYTQTPTYAGAAGMYSPSPVMEQYGTGTGAASGTRDETTMSEGVKDLGGDHGTTSGSY